MLKHRQKSLKTHNGIASSHPNKAGVAYLYGGLYYG